MCGWGISLYRIYIKSLAILSVDMLALGYHIRLLYIDQPLDVSTETCLYDLYDPIGSTINFQRSSREAWLSTTTLVILFLLSSLLKKECRRKWEWRVKILIESHAFLLDHFQPIRMYIEASIKLSHFSGCSYKKEQVVRSYPPSMIQLLLLASKTNERKQVTRF